MNSINLPFTVLPNIVGYTGALTPFIFVPSISVQPNIKNCLWNFGDGTFSTNLCATHIYNWPGVYTVSLISYDNNEIEYQSTFTQNISVTNLIGDSFYVTPAYPTAINIPAGRVSTPFTITRQNSWQSFPSVSATGYTFSFYASGSLSNKLDVQNLPTTKWAHIDRTWRFAEQNITQDGITQYIPVDNIISNNTNLYYRMDPVSGIPVSCGINDTGSVFVGTSGSATFYYIDDTPKNYDSSVPPVLLFISLDTTLFPDSYEISIPQNTIFSDLELFQHIKAIIPVYIRYNIAQEIIFTSAGMTDIPIAPNKWENTEIPFFINLTDQTGAIIDNYPPLTINTNLTTTSAFNVVNLQLLDSNNNILSASFYQIFDNQLPPAISGTFRGYFIPYETGNNITLNASVTLYNIQNVQFDTGKGWVAYPDTSTVYFVSPTTLMQEFNTNSNNILAIAVVPSASPDISVIPYAWFADADTDTLTKMDSNGNILTTIVLSTLANTSNKLSPSYLAIDGNNDIWVTLYDNAETIKINSQTLSLVLTLTSSVTNVQYLSSNVSFGGTNLVQPTIVDADIHNNIWICYTHPLCSFAEKYNGYNGAVLKTVYFSGGLTPSDMVIDHAGNAWITAGYYTGINPGTQVLTTPITATKLGKDNFGFGKFQYTFNTNLSTYLLSSYNYILTVNNLNDKYYNGKFLIESVSGNSVIVEPHPLAWYYASTKNISITAYDPILVAQNPSTAGNSCSAIFTFSDRVYKITPSGAVSYIDKFYQPSCITLDIAQNIYVSHCLTRVTQINALSTNITTNFTVGSAQVVLMTVDQRYIQANIPSNNLLEMLVTPSDGRAFQNITGITCDTANNLWVINDFENRVYFVPTNNMTVSAITWTDMLAPIPGNYSTNPKTLQAIGDWNGMRWINKYPAFETVSTITGSVSFNILPETGLYQIAKINENFDAAGTLKSYRFTEQLLNSTNLFDKFLGQSIDDVITENPEVLGKHIYERIANYTGNIADIDTCDIDALYSICAELDVPINNYQFLLPANLKRIANIISIKHSKLWGDRNRFNRDFNTRFSQNSSYGQNLGSKINTATYIVSAGTNIIFNQLFDNTYFLVKPMVLGYFNNTPLSSYPLSTYSNTWGWGLENGVTGTTLSKYYNVYTYNSSYENSQVEGVIDWNNSYNTIVETNSGIDTWLDDFQMVDTLIDYKMHQGLDLFLD